jgi:hypothetical protein
MTNRPKVVDLAGGIDAVLRDYVLTYPEDSLEAIRDSKRVHQAYLYRGTQFFTDVLPSFLEILLRGLEEGRLADTSGLPFGKHRSARVHVPRLFSGMWLRVFTGMGLLREDADPTTITCLLTILSLGKKLLLETPTKHLKEVYDEYVSIDQSLPVPSGLWDAELPDLPALRMFPESSLEDFGTSGLPLVQLDSQGAPENRTSFPSETAVEQCSTTVPWNGTARGWSLLTDVQRVADYTSALLGYFDPDGLIGRHGPGAVSDLPSGGYKFNFPGWNSRLECAFPYDLHGVLNSGIGSEDAGLDGSPPLSLEEGASELLHVPKTRKKPRLIAEEPTANQWCQQAVAQELRRRVGRSPLGNSISFFDQVPSQVDCLSASMSGQRATLDLSSASDRLSCCVVEKIFRRNLTLLRLLSATRTRYCVFGPTAPYRATLRLRKYASMGSALTFPVQSIVFAVLAIGVGFHLSGRGRLTKRHYDALSRSVRVFGDDIIVPKHWVDPLVSLLDTLGLRVNKSKSFREGNFRESCGMYAYRGYEVTPVRFQHAYVTDAATAWSYVDSSNHAFLKGFWNLSIWIEQTVLQGYRFPAVDRRLPPVGLVTNSVGIDPTFKRGWDPYLQREFIRIPRFLRRKESRPVTNGLSLYSELIGRSYVDRSMGTLWAPEPSPLRREVGTVHLGVRGEPPALLRRGRWYA